MFNVLTNFTNKYEELKKIFGMKEAVFSKEDIVFRGICGFLYSNFSWKRRVDCWGRQNCWVYFACWVEILILLRVHSWAKEPLKKVSQFCKNYVFNDCNYTTASFDQKVNSEKLLRECSNIIRHNIYITSLREKTVYAPRLQIEF